MIHVVGRSEQRKDWHEVLNNVDTFAAIIVSNVLRKKRNVDGDIYDEVLMFHHETGEPCGRFVRDPNLNLFNTEN